LNNAKFFYSTRMKNKGYQLIICEVDTGICLDETGRRIVGKSTERVFPIFETKRGAEEERLTLLEVIPWCEISIRNLESDEVDKPLQSPYYKEYLSQSHQHAKWLSRVPLLRILTKKPEVPLVEQREILYSELASE